MKKIIMLCCVLGASGTLSAQSVGIGTGTPNAKAQLDVSSTTKGLLVPRMTTSQRFAISTPPAGLMVYDTDKSEFYHYTGSAWTAMLNGNYWARPITSRDRIANSTDSVGIGTNAPTEWLDVDGNIRSRNNLMADNAVYATGLVSAGTLYSSSNLVVGGNGYISNNLSVSGTSTLTGDVTTTSDLVINNSTATLQLKSDNINKVFFQLSSGYNLRLGTNSGNTIGSLIIRMNGNDRITVDPSGNMNIEGKITNTAVTGFNNLLPLCYGRVSASGSILGGSGNFTIVKEAEGVYDINCTGISPSSTVMLSCEYFNTEVTGSWHDGNTVIVDCYNWYFDQYTNASFNFVIYK